MRLDTERNLPISIIMSDVNGLKSINDSIGHAMGDELLKKVAQVLSNGCRADDIIARLGGDEFVVLLPKTNKEQVQQLIGRINELLKGENVGSADVSVSFG
jgi:diguanylate cyclase (GGDEF)-like protein